MPTLLNTVTGSDHAVVGVADRGIGVHGTSSTSTGAGGVSSGGIGVHGVSKAGPGVRGDSESGAGVFGSSKASTAVGGISDTGIGVHGISKSADGVFGVSEQGRGVVGVATTATAVEGNSTSGAGVFGSSQTGIGVFAKGGGLAGLFEGNVVMSGNVAISGDVEVAKTVKVTGDVLLLGADCAEHFDVLDEAPPGSVMVIADDGRLRQSSEPYDTRVVGVIAGAGGFRPGILLGGESGPGRQPISLAGRVECMVDATHSPIRIGTLLTTSGTPGHAMPAADPHRAFGAVIGKALAPLQHGRGLIPILVSLQ